MEMTDEERDYYNWSYNRRLSERVTKKKKELSQKVEYKTNPDGFVQQVKRVTRRQMYEAFEYLTMIGVDVSTNPEMKALADR